MRLLVLALLGLFVCTAFAGGCDIDIKDVDIKAKNKIRKVCEWDVEKKAIKFGDHDCEKDRNHEWDFDRGKCVDAKFKITAFRKCTEIDKEFKVFFKLVVKNTGDERTKNLKVAVKIFKKEGYDWKEVANGLSQHRKVISDKDDLKPGESRRIECDVELDDDHFDYTDEFKAVFVVSADNHRRCGKCDVDVNSVQFKFEKKVIVKKGECAKVVDKSDDFCDKFCSCRFKDNKKEWKVCYDDLSDKWFDDRGREVRKWEKVIEVRVCNDMCKLKCHKKAELCNFVKVHSGDKKDRWDDKPCAEDKDCIKVHVPCRGPFKDRWGEICDKDDHEKDCDKDDKKEHRGKYWKDDKKFDHDDDDSDHDDDCDHDDHKDKGDRKHRD